MNLYLVASAIIFFLLALSWSSDSWTNLLIKAVLWIMSILGVLYSLVAYGYVVRGMK